MTSTSPQLDLRRGEYAVAPPEDRARGDHQHKQGDDHPRPASRARRRVIEAKRGEFRLEIVHVVPRLIATLSTLTRSSAHCRDSNQDPVAHPRPLSCGVDAAAKCRNLSELRTTYSARITSPSISNAAVCTAPSGPSTMTPDRPLMVAKRSVKS